MKLKVFIIPLLLLVLSCSKSPKSNNFPCDDNKYSYHIIPDSLNWFRQVVDSPYSSKNLQAKSSSGLSETINASKGSRWHQLSGCGDEFYFNSHYNYNSTLYDNRISLLVAFKPSFYPIDFLWYKGTVTVDTNNFQVIIHTTAINDTDTRLHFVDLIQDVSPNYSNSLKAVYYNADFVFKDQIICDTCVQYVGNYTQNNIEYNDVYRYKNPFIYGNGKAIKEFLIDKKYGIIQYTSRNNTYWSVSPF